MRSAFEMTSTPSPEATRALPSAVAHLVLVRSMRTVALTILVCCVLTAMSQIVYDDGKPPVRRRSPELEALNFMVGRWTSEFVVRETPESKEWKSKGVGVTQWSSNGQFLISDGWLLIKSPDSSPNFWGAKISVTTWDPLKKEYRVTEVSSPLTEISTMILEGKKITLRREFRKEGHVTTCRSVSEQISDTEGRVRTECSIDDGPTWVFMEGTSRRISD